MIATAFSGREDDGTPLPPRSEQNTGSALHLAWHEPVESSTRMCYINLGAERASDSLLELFIEHAHWGRCTRHPLAREILRAARPEIERARAWALGLGLLISRADAAVSNGTE